MLRRTNNGLVTYHFQRLTAEGLVHAIFIRLGGASREPFATLNVGRSVGDDQAAVAHNLARIYASLGLTPEQVATAHQVHSNRVAVVTAQDGGQVVPATDALTTDTPGLALLLRFADCQPILLYDPARHALGLVHAGWRGLAQGIARRAVETMQKAFGTNPSDLLAGLGPAIGPCCYTVGDDVASALGYALPDWRKVIALDPSGAGWRLDLPAANAQQLAAAGVRARRMEQAGLCTACHHDEFFSHRADNGQTGRFAAVACLPAGDQAHIRSAEAQPHQERHDREAAIADTLQPPGLPGFSELLGGTDD
ncbi:MAG: peptidoglycan editing factor PgeF [Anaerolineae bacterium]|nr:peptidoglycan editing factor PgeF [Anaerolineae bacterium]